jgi:hypothetical protein
MATRLTLPREQVLSDTGAPLPGAKLYTYSAGTSTPKPTYSDAGLTTANTNPLVADSAGRFGDAFLGDGQYKMTLTNAAGTQIWSADPVNGATSANSGVTTATENILINGDFRVNQRSSSTSFADDVYCLDRWYILTESGSITVGQGSLQEPGQVNNIRLTQPDSSSKRMGLAQIAELNDAGALRGQAVAMSARVRCSISQPIRYAILEWTGAANTPTSDVVSDWTSGSYTAGGFFNSASMVVVAVGSVTPSANVWTTLPTITGTISSVCNNLIVFVWTQGTIAQNATLDIGLARLVAGTDAGTFPVRPFASELALCQRYFEVANVNSLLRVTTHANFGGATLNIPWKVTKRTAPVLLLWSGANRTGSSGALTIAGTPSGSINTLIQTDGVLLYGGLTNVGDYASGSIEAYAEL